MCRQMFRSRCQQPQTSPPYRLLEMTTAQHENGQGGLSGYAVTASGGGGGGERGYPVGMNHQPRTVFIGIPHRQPLSDTGFVIDSDLHFATAKDDRMLV